MTTYFETKARTTGETYLGAIAALDPFQAKLPWGCVRLDRGIGR